jgi:hypothetical protein
MVGLSLSSDRLVIPFQLWEHAPNRNTRAFNVVTFDCRRNERGKNMTEEFGEAALRHLTDSEMLADGERWGGAGHLIGFAAECAIKHRIKTVLPKQDTPQGHFPDIIDIAKRHLTGRHHVTLLNVLKLPNLMQGWMVSLRYASNEAVQRDEYVLWQEHTVRLLHAAGLRRSN